ncbi:MAG: AbrB/MazE/SpoVT family DNA-binding domain-containing protein [Acidobacteriota bacterium]
METTRLSTKGQLILPKSVRDAKGWGAGTEFTVEETREGVLLRPAGRFPRTKLEDVVGILKYTGKPKTLAEMDQAITDEVKRRHARGRY